MKIYGSISAETMAQHEWVTLEDHKADMEVEHQRISALTAQLAETQAALDASKSAYDTLDTQYAAQLRELGAARGSIRRLENMLTDQARVAKP